MSEEINKLKEIIDGSDNIVFFGGAGLSTESGIPDFRSQDGLYNQQYEYPPETILSKSFFDSHEDVFFRFYREKCVEPILKAAPNNAHKALAKLEAMGKLKAIVTQNIDGLHEAAGSKNVFNVHGTTLSNTCIKCGKHYTINDVKNKSGIPKCSCGGTIRPDIVMYEEPLDNSVVNKAIQYISNAKTLIVAGTSLVVYPAASFINYFNGENVVLINKDPLHHEEFANLVIHGKVGEVLSEVVE